MTEHPSTTAPRTAARPRRRMKSTAVTVTATGLLAVSLAACSSPEDAYAGVCVDPQTQERVEDSECDDDGYRSGGSGVGAWYWLAYGRNAPSIGSRVSGGSFVQPDGARVKGGVPREGGSTAKTIRGGFSSGKVVGRGGFGG